MSWEEMVPEIKPCWCGKGTITYRMEMDDWNRIRSSKNINCPECFAKETIELEVKRQREEKRDAMYEKAKQIAVSKYLEDWLLMYAVLNKKAAWQLYTSEKGYPSLGTFYKHIKHEGIQSYMRRCFLDGFEDALKKMNIIDSEIQDILNERERI